MSKWYKVICIEDNVKSNRHTYNKDKEYYVYDHWHDPDAGETCLDIYSNGKFIETIYDNQFDWFYKSFKVTENILV